MGRGYADRGSGWGSVKLWVFCLEEEGKKSHKYQEGIPHYGGRSTIIMV